MFPNMILKFHIVKGLNNMSVKLYTRKGIYSFIYSKNNNYTGNMIDIILKWSKSHKVDIIGKKKVYWIKYLKDKKRFKVKTQSLESYYSGKSIKL